MLKPRRRRCRVVIFYRETPRCFQARAFLLEATLQAPRLGNDREDEYDDSEASASSSSSLLLLMLLLPLFATCFGTGTTSVFASSRKAASSQERGLTVLLPQQRLLRVVSNWIVRRGSVAALAALAFVRRGLQPGPDPCLALGAPLLGPSVPRQLFRLRCRRRISWRQRWQRRQAPSIGAGCSAAVLRYARASGQKVKTTAQLLIFGRSAAWSSRCWSWGCRTVRFTTAANARAYDLTL